MSEYGVSGNRAGLLLILLLLLMLLLYLFRVVRSFDNSDAYAL